MTATNAPAGTFPETAKMIPTSNASTPVADPLKTIESFNRQFMMKKDEKDAVAWAWPHEAGDKMFHVMETYTRAAQFDGLPAESSYRLQRVGGNILGILN